jgi:8-oxo-dGTP pyrophosphatase MutT (NUDIX family)
LSELSTPVVPDSLWYGGDIQLAASVVIIQPSTSRFVVISEKKTKVAGGIEQEYDWYFLPRGRKDIGESIEQTALREGYEEVRYTKHLGERQGL